ncbi:uncharacterized protein LOC135499086 isoform X5 [Lineus longissimus]|uniref:uncharacterized protein LOC135499086 isoform X5 n=1 Tax=Lineus longissimus TaxID=88925 RepID=UPI00315DDBA3
MQSIPYQRNLGPRSLSQRAMRLPYGLISASDDLTGWKNVYDSNQDIAHPQRTASLYYAQCFPEEDTFADGKVLDRILFPEHSVWKHKRRESLDSGYPSSKSSHGTKKRGSEPYIFHDKTSDRAPASRQEFEEFLAQHGVPESEANLFSSKHSSSHRYNRNWYRRQDSDASSQWSGVSAPLFSHRRASAWNPDLGQMYSLGHVGGMVKSDNALHSTPREYEVQFHSDNALDRGSHQANSRRSSTYSSVSRMSDAIPENGFQRLQTTRHSDFGYHYEKLDSNVWKKFDDASRSDRYYCVRRSDSTEADNTRSLSGITGGKHRHRKSRRKLTPGEAEEEVEKDDEGKQRYDLTASRRLFESKKHYFYYHYNNAMMNTKSGVTHMWAKDLVKYLIFQKPTSELMAAIQLGIGQSIGGLSSKPERDVLMQDFTIVDSVFFPGEGSNLTPAHHYSDFRFKTYAPMAFRYFREMFDIQPDDFLYSMCNEPMTELSNPGASGSVFYITSDDEFIIKTVQHKEAEFLQKLLPGYYMNLNQNPRTLLPKFYGLYCYQCGGKNIRFVVMNNLLPSTIRLHEKYDLKGSTYKRKASKRECAKKTPTLKDLDFADIHLNGILLEQETHTALVKTITRDCRVLESFKIMDYSMLLGVHNLDIAEREKKERAEQQRHMEAGTSQSSDSLRQDAEGGGQPINKGLQRAKSMKTRLAAYSTALESIQAESDPIDADDDDISPGGIPARNSKGERLLLYIGVIDILQNYRLRKKMEHTFKSIVHDGDTISVHRPSFYAQRFQSFFSTVVFRKIPSLDQPQVKGSHMRFRKLVHLALKHSPSKKKAYGRSRAQSTAGQTDILEDNPEKDKQEEAGAIGGRPDLLPTTSTPPPPFEEAEGGGPLSGSHSEHTYTSPRGAVSMSVEQRHIGRYSPHSNGDHMRMATSPAHSASESTPTHTEFTEGTPSFTTSSPSLCSESIDVWWDRDVSSSSAHRFQLELAVNTSHLRGSQELEELRETVNDGIDNGEPVTREPEVMFEVGIVSLSFFNLPPLPCQFEPIHLVHLLSVGRSKFSSWGCRV